MRTFEDKSGRVWTLDLGVGAIRRIKSLLDVDLTQPQAKDPVHGTLSQRMAVDVWLLVDVLCAICRPQAEALAISDEDFAELLGGDVLGNARNLLLEEWSDFFLSLGRKDLATAVTKTLAMLVAISEEAVGQMDKLENQLLEEAKATMEAAGQEALSTAIRTMSGD